MATKGKAGREAQTQESAQESGMTWDQFVELSQRRGIGKRESQYTPFVRELAMKTPTDATAAFPKANVRTLRSAIAKVGRQLGYKVKTVLIDDRLVVARVE